jgi:hypothetical protein
LLHRFRPIERPNSASLHEAGSGRLGHEWSTASPGCDIEVGGHVFGTQRPQRDCDFVSVCHASWAGEGGVSRRQSLSLGDGDAVAAELPAHFRRLGNWHTHALLGEDPREAAVPSPADLKAWAGTAARMGVLDGWVGLIATPDPVGGWSFPGLTAWVTRVEGSPGRWICERAVIV